MAKVYLIEAQPWNASTGTAQATRLAGGGNRAYDHLGFTDWKAGISDAPLFSSALEFAEEGWTGGAIPQTSQIRFATAQESVRTALSAYLWKGASITFKTADDEAAAPTYVTELVGTVAGLAIKDGALFLTVQDLSGDLSKTVLVDRFAGTGGIEGDADCAGRIKRRSWGRVFNVEGFVLRKASNIYEFQHPSFPISSFDAVRDKGRDASPAPTVVAWAGSIAATLTALDAVTPAAGSCAVAPSIGCVKWWTQPSGPLTADLRGEVGAGYVEDAPAIASRIVAARSGSVTMANLAAASALRPDPAGMHFDDASETIGNGLDRLLMGCSLAWVVEPAGTLRILPYTFSGPVETLTSDEVTREAVFRPTRSRRIGYARNHRIHTAAEISAAVLLGDVDFANVTGATKPQDNATRNVNRDAWSSASVAYVPGDEVTNAGSTWQARTIHTSTAGNGPPTLPTTSNTNWILRAQAGAAGATGAAGAPGATGATGATGSNGITYYEWVAFADSSDGTVNFNNGLPNGRTWIGRAAGKTTPTESSTPSDYEWSPYRGPPSFGLVAGANMTVSGDRLFKSSGAYAWDAQVYSSESFTGAAFMSFRPEVVDQMMFGLNTDPTTDATFTSLDYCIYVTVSGYECRAPGGTVVFSGGAWSLGDTFSLFYRGTLVEFRRNNTVVYSMGAPSGLTLWLDSSIAVTGFAATILAWNGTGADAPAGFALVASSGAAFVGGKLRRTAPYNAASVWDQKVYSATGFKSGAFVEFGILHPDGAFMVGLNDDPLGSNDWPRLSYAFYVEGGSGGGPLYSAESGGLTYIGTWVSTDRFKIHYDNASVRYFKISGTTTTLLRTVAVTSDQILFLDSAVPFPREYAEVTAFGAAGPLGATGATGAAGTPGATGATGATGAAGVSALSIAASLPVIKVARFSGGAIRAGLPATTQLYVFAGFTDVTASTSYSKAQTNCTVVDNGGGNFTVNTLSSATDAYFTVTATYGAYPAVTITIPIAQTEDGGASVHQEDLTITFNNTATYSAANGGPLTLTSGPLGTVTLSALVSYAVASGSAKLGLKVQYRTTPGSGGWTDIGSEEVDAFSATPSDPSTVSMVRTITGPNPSANWEFQLLGRRVSGTGTMVTSGADNKFVAEWAG